MTERDTFFALCQLDKASTVMTVEEGIVPSDVGARTAVAVAEVLDAAALPGASRPTDYLGVEPLLRERIGSDASRIHAGRSRQDMLATVHRLLIRDRTSVLVQSLTGLRSALLVKAERYATSVVPAYTNGVQAQPVTFGHLLLGYEAALCRATTRFVEAWPRINTCPLGVAALATSSFPVNRVRLAELLGFDAPVRNSFDAAQLSVIDVGFEVASCAMGVALSIGTFVQDVHAQFHHSRPWILLDDALLAPSTLMPQKRNPVALNRARLLASEVLGDGVATAFAAHNVCSGLTDYKRGEVNRTLERATALLAEVHAIVAAMRLDDDAALEELRGDWSTASELANALQQDADVAFHDGHRFASALVTFGRASGVRSGDVAFADLTRIYEQTVGSPLPLDEERVRAALDPVTMVNAYRGLGGAQPAEVDRMVVDAKASLAVHESWLADVTARAAAAEVELEERFAAIRGASRSPRS